MPTGKQLGEFSFKFTTFINQPGPGGILRQVTWEGMAAGFGTVFTTVTFTGGSKAGTFSECGTAFLDNGEFSSRHRSRDLRECWKAQVEDRGLLTALGWPQDLRRGRDRFRGAVMERQDIRKHLSWEQHLGAPCPTLAPIAPPVH